MSSVTLIGESLATEGREFVYEGEASGCAECPYRQQCLNLEVGNGYRVTDVRDGAQSLPCAVHADDVVAVEVEPASVAMNVPERQALSGNKTTPAGGCPHVDCPSHGYCLPGGEVITEEHRIVDVIGEPPHETCELDRTLTLVNATQD